MAFDIVRTKSFNVTLALAAQYIFVTLDSNGQAVVPSAGGDAIGVTQDTTQYNGDPTAVCYPGDITKVLCSATIAAGGLVSTDAAGNAIPSVSGDFVLGKAITAGAAGFLATILYQPQGRLDP